MDRGFAALGPEKRERLIRECTREFAEHGYSGASTNRIVRRLGIAKGSLFHYCGTKRRLFLALLDIAAEDVRRSVESVAKDLPADPVERVVALARSEFAVYAARPELYRLFRRALSDPDSAELVRERYAESSMSLFANLLEKANFAEDVDRMRAVSVLAWIVNGFNEAFLSEMHVDDAPAALAGRYETGLRSYLSIVEPCMCRPADHIPDTGDYR